MATLFLLALLCAVAQSNALSILKCDRWTCKSPGVCVNNVCETSAPHLDACARIRCRSGFQCDNGRCVPQVRDCALVDCDKGTRCVDGECIPIDSAPSGCPKLCPLDFSCVNGRCVPPTSTCTVDHCSKLGKDASCTIWNTQLTCAAWFRIYKPRCRLACPRNCLINSPDAPRDNTGKKYCNECVLKVASCKSGFQIYGPVDNLPLPPPSPVGQCSTAGNLFGPTLCPNGKTCVIFDFGFPAADRPNAGNCEVVDEPVPTCTVPQCTMTGASGVCETADTNTVTTCAAWATRSDGNEKPVCNGACPEFCMADRLVDNKGNEYCNLCFLQFASCDSQFKLFGPVGRSAY